MRVTIQINIGTKEDGSVVVNENDLRERILPIVTGRILDQIEQQFPSRTHVAVNVYEGTRRLDHACVGNYGRIS